MSDIKALEHSTLMVPYEILNKTFRNAQKVIDREASHVVSSNDKLKKLSSKNNVTVANTSNEMEEVLSKLHLLKKKATDAIAQEQQRLNTCFSRIELLKKQVTTKNSIIWKHNRLDRMLVDYFLRSGYYDTAVNMAEKSGITEYVDIDLFLVARDVETALRVRNSTVCLLWCHNNKSKLKKLQSTLELNVRIQEFVELVRKEQRLEAVAYARKYFSSGSGESYAVPEIQKTVMALLAFKPNTQIKRYKELFDEARWDLLIDQFRKENFALHQLNCQSILEIVLQCGLASMKTPHCYHKEENSQECPVCNRVFNELAKPLPFAHSSQSRLLCTLSGERMNENNHPLMLPNGNVYGELSLRTLANASEDNVILCPRSQQVYTLDETRKIFIM